jgi:L-alanine-DL-glutamate epimerase-like enolase superfamily enzyme
MPDVTCCGGILGLKEISAMAEPYGAVIAPHDFNCAIGMVANLHVAAAIPNFLICDYYQAAIAASEEVLVNPIRAKDGYMDLPTGPGLGVELDEKALLERPFRETSPRQIRTYLEERA